MGKGWRQRQKTEGSGVNVGNRKKIWTMSLMNYRPCYMSVTFWASWSTLDLRERSGGAVICLVLQGKVSRIAFWFTGKKGKISQFQVKYTYYPASWRHLLRKSLSSILSQSQLPGELPVSPFSNAVIQKSVLINPGRDHSASKSLAPNLTVFYTL